jgi:glucose-1-phosphate thymidylyltransferase
MRIIVPMAGRGSRLRPHTLTTPKPLLPVAGKPIVQRLVEDLARIYNGPVEEIVFIVGNFGQETEQMLLDVATALGSRGRIAYQDEPLGTAHALACAGESLNDEIIIAFADTLFTANFTLDKAHDGVIWVKQVSDPKAYGVVTVNADGVIDQLVEKPQEFVSDLAIIGIYYVKDGSALHREIRHLLDNDIKTKGEYQLTDALENLKAKGAKFTPGQVDEWMDCGNKDNLLETNSKVLSFQEEAIFIQSFAHRCTSARQRYSLRQLLAPMLRLGLMRVLNVPLSETAYYKRTLW